MTKPVTPEDVARVRSLNLRDEDVRKAMSGFVHLDLKHRYGINLPREELAAIFGLFVKAIDISLDDAAVVYNEMASRRRQ